MLDDWQVDRINCSATTHRVRESRAERLGPVLKMGALS
jgi:hypothetical protein